MCDAPRYTIHSHRSHLVWDNTIEPVERVTPGATVAFSCKDAAAGHFKPGDDAEAVNRLDLTRTNPVTGPVWVEGAEPGDALKVTFDGFSPSGLGWTANIPGFGLLSDQFPDPALRIWTYDGTASKPALWGAARVPLKPFPGTIGNAPAAPGRHSVIPPRRVGGNLDTRDLAEGTVLYLPVEVPGALLSVGDTHAAQGDGEVCGTAIESAIDVVLTIDLVKHANLAMPRFTTPGPVSRHLDAGGYEVTTGVGPDLMEGARIAVSQMVELIATRHGLAPVDAYLLVSVCADLRISEIVDEPNFVVAFYFPRAVLD